MRRPSRTTRNPAQLALFGPEPPSEDQLIAAYYRRLRKLGVTLHLDRATPKPEIVATRQTLSVPGWWAAVVRRHWARIAADLERVEHGVEPEIAREDLGGGAQLIRLPARRDPDPPVAQRAPSRTPRKGGSA